MKRFEFKLGRLARVRAVQEEQARARWQSAAAAARQLEEHVQATSRDIDQALDYLRSAQACAALDTGRVLNAHEALQLLERRRADLRRRHLGACARAEELRAPWQAVRTELEGLKRLEDKARGEHRRERERQDAATTDQIAIERATRGENGADRRRA